VTLAALAGRTGRGVRVAIVDTGVHGAHPHVGGISAARGVDLHGRRSDEVADRLGHGTAVAAAIREKAPACDLVSVRVFGATLSTSIDAIDAGIRVAVDLGATLINLSLGTSNQDHEPRLVEAVTYAAARGAVIVSAAPQGDVRWLPGALAGVAAVEVDDTLARDALAIRSATPGRLVLAASPLPRPAPGIPAERNFRGPSFAVANATGILAAGLEGASAPGLDAMLSLCYRVLHGVDVEPATEPGPGAGSRHRRRA
jgi:subtilisin family serine protease